MTFGHLYKRTLQGENVHIFIFLLKVDKKLNKDIIHFKAPDSSLKWEKSLNSKK